MRVLILKSTKYSQSTKKKHVLYTFLQRNALYYLVYIYRQLVSSVKMYALYI